VLVLGVLVLGVLGVLVLGVLVLGVLVLGVLVLLDLAPLAIEGRTYTLIPLPYGNGINVTRGHGQAPDTPSSQQRSSHGDLSSQRTDHQ